MRYLDRFVAYLIKNQASQNTDILLSNSNTTEFCFYKLQEIFWKFKHRKSLIWKFGMSRTFNFKKLIFYEKFSCFERHQK